MNSPVVPPLRAARILLPAAFVAALGLPQGGGALAQSKQSDAIKTVVSVNAASDPGRPNGGFAVTSTGGAGGDGGFLFGNGGNGGAGGSGGWLFGNGGNGGAGDAAGCNGSGSH